MADKERCARCGDTKVLAGYRGRNKGYFCEDCAMAVYYEELEEENEQPDYDEVVTVAKEMGWDPYDARGEYKPAVISAAIAEIERRKEADA